MNASLTMRAALCEGFGGPDTVRVADVPKPRPGDHDVLVRIRASTLDSGDRRVRSLDMPPGFGPLARLAFGFRKPRQPILGTALAGIVEAVGPAVTRFRPGDEVVASTGAAQGCHAEYRVIGETKGIVHKPPALGFDEAAALIFGGMAASQFLLDKARVAAGERVLITGAGGALGILAIQIAKARGAHVTASCSAGKADWVRSFGADAVLDYRSGAPIPTEPGFDIIFDTAGSRPVREWFPLLRPQGRICPLAASLLDLLAMPLLNLRKDRKVLGGVATDTALHLARLMEMAKAGQVRAAISARIPLEDIRRAHEIIDGGHKAGSLVITMA